MEPMQAFSLFFFKEKSCQLQSALPFRSLPITGKKGAGEGWENPINRGSGGVTEQPAVMLQRQAGAWGLLRIAPSVTLCALEKSLAATRDGRDPSLPSSVLSAA